MSKLSSWSRKNPEAASFLKRLALLLLNNHSASERQAMLDELADLDGNGVPDALEQEPQTTPAPRKRARK